MNNVKHTKIAISMNGMDCLRIIPLGKETNKAEIKISFLDQSFIVRRFIPNKNKDGFLFNYTDYGLTPNEITYHNSNELHPKPSILPKNLDKSVRIPITQHVLDLDLKNLLLPIPICRVTVNQESNKIYKHKEYHNNINLDSKYNTTEFYISSCKYDSELIAERFPLITHLFNITTIDHIIYGAGVGCMPVMTKMFENKEPIIAIESDIIDKYRIHYRTYTLSKNNAYFLYSNPEYSKSNFIEFFDNIDYLDLLATTEIGFEKNGINQTKTKPAYIYDIENLKKIEFHNDYIKKWLKRFQRKEFEYKAVKKKRCGIIFKEEPVSYKRYF